MNKCLMVDVVENGFSVMEREHNSGFQGKTWVFEYEDSLAKFIIQWGNDQKAEGVNK
jgi:hypothetical protein